MLYNIPNLITHIENAELDKEFEENEFLEAL